MWDFTQIVEFGRAFAGPAGTELAFVLSEWTPEGGLTLSTTYPAVRADVPPTEDAPAAQVARLWVKLNNGAWQKVSSIPTVTNVGLGTAGVVQSGVVSSMVIKGWAAKGIAAGYIVAPEVTMNLINSQRTTGLALIRTYVNSAETAHPLAPDTMFTPAQVTVLATWLNAHGVSNAEFAALFGVTAGQLSNWLQTNPRWRFAQVVHEKFA